MLFWFRIRAKLWAHTLKASLPCSLLPLHRTFPSPQPSQKHLNRFAPHYVLASLVKGRWIDGKAQTVALLRFTCDMPTLFMLQTLLPPRRRDCRTQPFQNRTIPPTFRNANIYMHLYAFTFALSHSLFVGRGSVCAFLVSHPCETLGTHA